MNKFVLALALCGAMSAAVTLPASVAEAAPGGCLKYGAAGAVAGHVAGGHAVRGAVLGCAAGMYRRHLYNKQQRELQKQQGAPADHT